MKDIIIGAVANYDWHHIRHWCNSLDQSGFKGDKMVVVYNCSDQLARELKERDYIVIDELANVDMNRFEGRSNEVITLRFRHKWTFLNGLDLSNYRYIISTDVRDVIFQTDPSIWVEKNIRDKRLLAVDEGLTFGQMQWAPDMMRHFFGHYFRDYIKNCKSYNVGVMAGEAQVFRDFVAQIYLTCFSAQFRQFSHHGIDQMAFNLLLSLYPWKSITSFTSCRDSWVTHLGVQADPKNPHLIDAIQCTPQERDGIIYPPDSNTPYAIVHQFDRVPGWEMLLKEKYL